ncbi:MAG TPA: hypothetical protein VGT06_07305 [Candidatus Methylomirabilis sp.]|jgi:hypothetical protein|nr:hypothetical protein [Candidatus Methylomirabilis sp.]
MKKLITLGLLVATVAFTGTVFADGGTLQDRELQKLFESSGQVADRAAKATQTAGPGAQATHEIPPVLEHRGSTIK